jgi:two-component system sensor histidine kinase/response regulator
MSYEILIVDDKYEDIHILDEILSNDGYLVRVARDGNSGLRAAQYDKPDLIILDVMLPDIDGLTICQQLRADENLSDIPVIIVSAVDDVNLKARAFEVGAYDYVTKPFNQQEILIRLQHQLERVYLHRQIQDNIRVQERHHIARELHDSVNQTLFVMKISAQSLMMDAEKLPPEILAELENLNKLSHSSIAEMRTLLNELRPSQITETPMPKLMQQLVDAYRLRVNAEISLVVNVNNIPDNIKHVFYRITQEALNNVAKYATASHLRVSLMDEELQYRLIIEDDGRGFDVTQKFSGIGLLSMRERAINNNLDFMILSDVGIGTRIEAIWKIES